MMGRFRPPKKRRDKSGVSAPGQGQHGRLHKGQHGRLHKTQQTNLKRSYWKLISWRNNWIAYSLSEKTGNGNSEDEATQMAHKHTNYMKDPEATLKLPIQLLRESARLPDVANENLSSTVHQRSGAAWWSKTFANKINILSEKIFSTRKHVEKYKILKPCPTPSYSR